jgi:hypothetical protein
VYPSSDFRRNSSSLSLSCRFSLILSRFYCLL